MTVSEKVASAGGSRFAHKEVDKFKETMGNLWNDHGKSYYWHSSETNSLQSKICIFFNIFAKLLRKDSKTSLKIMNNC